MNKVLDIDFYNHEDVLAIAKSLLNKVICTRKNGNFTSGKIVETEAYRGPDDKACHAFNYRRSAKNEAMYGPAGTAYVYTCYGLYDLFNIVTADINVPHAVLIRAIEPLEGIQIMSKRRNGQSINNLTSGPGKLAIALGINKKWNGQNLMEANEVWVEDHGYQIEERNIISGPRVGLSTAEECSNWPWRFRVIASNFTSKPKTVHY